MLNDILNDVTDVDGDQIFHQHEILFTFSRIYLDYPGTLESWGWQYILLSDPDSLDKLRKWAETAVFHELHVDSKKVMRKLGLE